MVKVDVTSPDLMRLNRLISSSLRCTDTFPVYKPHVTLAYVLPGKGQRYAGMTDVDGMELTFDAMTFSDLDGEKTKLRLTGVSKGSKLPVLKSRLPFRVKCGREGGTGSPGESEVTMIKLPKKKQKALFRTVTKNYAAPIKVDLPDMAQDAAWDCGANCLRAVASHFGVGPESEQEFVALQHPRERHTPVGDPQGRR